MTNYITLFAVLDLFKDYGIIITILILAILIAYLIIKNSTKRIHDQELKIDSLYDRIDELMGNFKKVDKNTELAGKFISYAENANKIQIQLYHLLQNFKCERVSIYEFHNGGKNLAGVEFKKCSNTYEAVSLETKPKIKELQNLPLSINPLWNKVLASHDDINIECVADLDDNFLKEYLEGQSIKTYYAVLLESYDKTPIGFMTLEYYENSVKLTKKQYERFNEIAITISVLINIK